MIHFWQARKDSRQWNSLTYCHKKQKQTLPLKQRSSTRVMRIQENAVPDPSPRQVDSMLQHQSCFKSMLQEARASWDTKVSSKINPMQARTKWSSGRCFFSALAFRTRGLFAILGKLQWWRRKSLSTMACYLLRLSLTQFLEIFSRSQTTQIWRKGTEQSLRSVPWDGDTWCGPYGPGLVTNIQHSIDGLSKFSWSKTI